MHSTLSKAMSFWFPNEEVGLCSFSAPLQAIPEPVWNTNHLPSVSFHGVPSVETQKGCQLRPKDECRSFWFF